MRVALPRLERGLADAGDDFVLGAVLVRAVVDLAEEEIGGEFGRDWLGGEDGAGGLARALERAGAGGGERRRREMACRGLRPALCPEADSGRSVRPPTRVTTSPLSNVLPWRTMMRRVSMMFMPLG